jgi:hypothetical protein
VCLGWKVWAGALYPTQGASTRLRVESLRPHVEDLGGTLTVNSFIKADQFGAWLRGGWGRLETLKLSRHAYAEALEGMRGASAAVVQREFTPWNVLRAERRVSETCPFVWDVDDSLWTRASGLASWARGSERKYEWLAKNASEVWTASPLLADWCRMKGTSNVFVVPTTTPLPTLTEEPDNPPRLVWIGSPATAKFVEELIFSLRVELKSWAIDIIGATIAVPNGVTVSQHPWSPEVEDRLLRGAWAGLYPIDRRHPLAEGKGAFKATLYASYALPTIASRTSPTEWAIRDGVSGFLVQGRHQWIDALKAVRDPLLRRELSIGARMRAEGEFGHARWCAWRAERLGALAGC